MRFPNEYDCQCVRCREARKHASRWDLVPLVLLIALGFAIILWR